jgi:integrase
MLAEVSEVCMRWEWIDFERRTITVQNAEGFTTKSKQVRVLPIADEAYTVLVGRRERSNTDSVRVFEGPHLTPGHVTFKAKQTILRANLPANLHLHSLGRTFASWLVQGGVSLYQVSKLMGHASTTTTAICAHVTADQLPKLVSYICVVLATLLRGTSVWSLDQQSQGYCRINH